MKFNMVRESLLITKAQDSLKRNDQRIRHSDHCDYTYLTDIPSSGDVDEAFSYFAATVCKDIEYFTSISDYFSEVQFLLDDKRKFWTMKFRFDKYRLGEEYNLDTESA